MASPAIPPFIKTDPQTLALLVQEGGNGERPPLENKNGEYLLHQDQWNQWLNRQGTSHKWPSFVDLFKAQGHDDNKTSLSVEDLQLTKISGTKQKEAEMELVKSQGYPEAVILDQDRQIARMPDGRFWVGQKEDEKYTFKPMARQEGRGTEAEIAKKVLDDLDEKFNEASPKERLFMKSTMGRARSASISSGGARHHRFADAEYRLGNTNSKIAYKKGGDADRYFLYQPQNGCVAASILNGAIFSDAGITNDPKLLEKFYTKLKRMQGSVDGRIDVDLLVDSIQGGKIPGLAARSIEADEMEKLVSAKIAVVAVVPYFFGHAFLIASVDREKNTYRAVDTVSGMMVEMDYFDPEEEEIKPVSISDGETDELLARFKKFVEKNPEFRHLILRGHELQFPESSTSNYYLFEVRSPSQFLAWVNS